MALIIHTICKYAFNEPTLHRLDGIDPQITLISCLCQQMRLEGRRPSL